MRAQQWLSSLGLAACLVSTFLVSPDARAQLEGEGDEGKAADLRVTIVSGPVRLTDGSSAEYQAVVQNFGPDPAHRVFVDFLLTKDNLQAIGFRCRGADREHDFRCFYRSLSPHQSVTVKFVVRASLPSPSVGEGAQVGFAAFASTDDPDERDNIAVLHLMIERSGHGGHSVGAEDLDRGDGNE